MITREHKPYISLITSMLDKLPHINKWRRDFLIETFVLFLSIRGRINFLQLGRYGKYKEQRYWQQFEKSFDFLTFNKELTLSQGSGKYVIAFDPSFINKSGKKTPGLSWYWSGCANRAKWGLEIGGFAAIDIDNHTAIHLVADAWFSKKPFTDQIVALEMHLISRLRDDADLKYLYKGPHTGKKGRPRKYDGKIISNDIDKEYFHHNRFQIEFLYRDGKQHTGLNDSQARSENKLHFQFNASLTSINIAKAIHWLSIP
jgi:hypothetical protein